MGEIRRLGALAVAGVILVSCSGTGAETTTTTTAPSSTTTTATSTTTTTTSTTTTSTTQPPATTTTTTTTTADPLARPEVVVSNMNRDSVDDFDPTGDDLYHVAIELVDLFNYLEGHPTGTAEEMAGLMYEPDYPYWDEIVANFEELTSHPGWHYADAGIRTLGIEVLDVSGDTATVVVVEDRDIQLIRDAERRGRS